MKSLLSSLAFAAFLSGCASTGLDGANQAGTVNDPNSIYSDPTYPGPGVHLGIGVGKWGGRSGAGVGFGLGF